MINRVTLMILSGVVASVSVYAADANQPAATADKPKAAAPKQAASAPMGGVVVFKDPVTGQIRQPDASEIGALVGSGAASGPASQTAVTPAITGTSGTAGLRLGSDSMVFMTVTKTPDGKLVEDCVTGDKAAEARVAGDASKAKQTTNKKEALDVQ